MRYVIVLAILALAYSDSSFLRNLKEESAPETTTDSRLAGTFTAANFSIAGHWTMHNTNCTSTCIPTVFFSAINEEDTQYILTLSFPTDDSCGDLSGQEIQQNETTHNGFWYDNDTNSILYEAAGVYFINNRTAWTWQRDVANPKHFCWTDWTTTSSIATNEVAPTEKRWEGGWELVTALSADGSPCCLTDLPILVIEDLATQTISVMWRNPDCDACGDLSNTVASSNMSVVGGAGYFTSPFLYTYLFLVDESVIYANPLCAAEYQKIVAPTCVLPEGKE
jgi:hypothetical protein